MLLRIVCGWLAGVLLLAFSGAARAEEPYRGYRYDFTGNALSAVNGYAPEAVVTGMMLGIGAFSNPEDLFADAGESRLYVLDSGNKRVVVLNAQLQLVDAFSTYLDNGRELPFTGLSSIFVTRSAIYLADQNNGKILMLEKGTRRLLHTYVRPESTTYPNANFIPYRIVVDSAGNLYALCKGVFQGAVVFDAKGQFSGYYGTTLVVPTLRVILSNLWKRIMTPDQKSVMERFVPTEYVGLAIDREDFIYTVTQYQNVLSHDSLRKLNPKGVNILHPECVFGDIESYVYRGKWVITQFTDVCADADGFFYGLDITYGRVLQYDDQSNLVFAFGGNGLQQGTFRQPCAIDVLGERVFVLDRLKASVTVFAPTEFGQKVRAALILYNDGRYDQAREPWREVLRQDSGYKMAYVGLGNAELNLHNYAQAMEYFKIGHNSKGYSTAYKQYRMIKWKGQNYFTVNWPFNYPDWFFYNPQVFEANGLETPAEAYAKGEWDWNKVFELAQALTQDMDGDGQTDQWGLGWAGGAFCLHMQTGVSLVEIVEDGSIKLNLRDPKIEAAANLFRNMGPAGSNVMLKDGGEITQDYIMQQFAAGNVAMMIGGWWRSQLPELAPNWLNGKLAVAHLPKWPGEEASYRGGQIGSAGIGAGCKNPEGAALFLEVMKYTTTEAYQQKYNPDSDSYIDWREVYGLSEEQIATIRSIDTYNGPQIPNLFWIFWGWDDGFYSALTTPWSQVVEQLEPIAQAGIDSWMEKLSQID